MMPRRVGRLGRNTAYTTVALGLRAVMQAAYLILLSRTMGPNEYGLFAGSVAAAVLLAPLSGWGVSMLVSERVGKHAHESRSMWAGALAQTTWSGGLLAIVVLLAVLALPDRLAPGPMTLLVLSELLLVPMTQSAATLMLALGRGAAGASNLCVISAFRLLAGGAWILAVGDLHGSSAAVMHVVGSIVGAIVVVSIVRRVVGAADWKARPSISDMFSRGKAYALGMLVGAAYTEVDKVLLLQIANATVAGLYTAAFRVAAVMAIPVTALTSNALPRLFAAAGTNDWPRIFRAVAAASAAYAIGIAVVAFALAGFMPLVFGVEFAKSTEYLRLLCPWVVLYAAHIVLATALTSLGRQRLRVIIESFGLALVIGINVALIPTHGARAAAFALLATDATVALACAIALLRVVRQSRPQTR
jgi:O-antigen/teichoic acid export membrane protein